MLLAENLSFHANLYIDLQNEILLLSGRSINEFFASILRHICDALFRFTGFQIIGLIAGQFGFPVAAKWVHTFNLKKK